jgi:hypothetical protein
LGNQLFQYAFGRHLALKNNTGLKLELSFLENTTIRKYALKPFCINTKIATPGEFGNLKQHSFSKLNKFKKALFNSGAFYIREENVAFNPSYLHTGCNAAIDGYWQSEKYFIDSSEQIRKDLKIKIKPSVPNDVLLSEIQSGNSISLHIRRGDYQTKEGLNIHGACDMEYYNKAVEFIASEISMPVFYIFSDDPAWVRQNLNLAYPLKVIDINNDDTNYEDLRLMANCKHNIANSTFSWWGAWLNENSNKIVITPKRWFADVELEKRSSSIIPEGWIRL